MTAIIDAIWDYFAEKPRPRPQLIFVSLGQPEGSTLIGELRRLGIKG
jgi:hypothetical protein